MYPTSLYWTFLRTCSSFLLYWIFLSTCTSHNWNEFSWLDTLYFTILKLLDTCTSPMNRRFLSTYTSLHFIEDSWVDMLYFSALNHYEYMYFTSLCWSFSSTCISLHCIEAYLVHLLNSTVFKLHIPHFTLLKILE